MLNCLFVGLGGFLGAVARYLCTRLPLAPEGGFPLTTLFVNVLGAFVIGLIAAGASKHAGWDPRLVLLLKAGVCGGFTTFSTFALETSSLLQGGKLWTAAAYILLSVLLSVGAVVLAERLVG